MTHVCAPHHGNIRTGLSISTIAIVLIPIILWLASDGQWDWLRDYRIAAGWAAGLAASTGLAAKSTLRSRGHGHARSLHRLAGCRDAAAR